MCTLTWWLGREGRYEVFFNRDELKDREPAWPPRPGERAGVRYLAPIDPRAGGTWLLANEAGLTLALLNWYENGEPITYLPEWGSRGALVLDLADVTSRDELERRLASVDGGGLPPFWLVAFVPDDNGGNPAVMSWRGLGRGSLVPVEVSLPVCSSSFDTLSVLGRRRDLLAGVDRDDPEALWAYHHGVGDSEPPGADSVRMHRPDAQTWSISRVTVAPERVTFRYEAEPPNLDGERDIVVASLERSLSGQS
ncbi:MAG: NRDE family protein [Verrucomicrobiales bacterium]|nr:NRDE family protein [Verrucomicrobiales bacterium]